MSAYSWEQVYAAFHTELWKDFDQTKAFPDSRPKLAHYTSLANLERILSSNELWFSHPFAMNDLEELRFGIDHGRSKFVQCDSIKNACETAEHHENLLSSFSEEFNEFDEGALDIYIFCLSLHEDQHQDGRLSMWRGYGADGNGVAVVIDTDRLYVADGPAFIVAPVEYKTCEERLALIDAALDRIAALIIQVKPSLDQMSAIAKAYLARLTVFSLYTKHKGFEDENEWRASYIKPLVDKMAGHEAKKEAFNAMLSYAVTNSGVQPKLKFNPKLLPGNRIETVASLIDHIILGPAAAPTAFERLSIRRMLEKLNLAHLAESVRVSETPYKPNK